MAGQNMARLSELVETIARVEGMDLATVRLIARNLREAGLITTSGRGPSAAKMTLADASNLLIAVNASDRVQKTGQTVRTYRRLEAYAYGPRPHYPCKLDDALQQLIQAASNKALPARYGYNLVPGQVAEAFSKEQITLVIDFDRPFPRVSIDIHTLEWRGPSNDLREQIEQRDHRLGFVFLPPHFHPPSPKSPPLKDYGDRADTTTIGYSTIRAVGGLFPATPFSPWPPAGRLR
jgi:hypothetical protein